MDPPKNFLDQTTHMISVYDKFGLRIAYPENWQLSEEESPEATVQITIASPETAFWTVAIYPGLQDLEDLANQVVEALLAEYPDLEINPIQQTVGDQALIGCDMNFICLDLSNTAQVRVCHRDGNSLLLFSQAEDSELVKAGQIFEAMSESLLSNSLELPSE